MTNAKKIFFAALFLLADIFGSFFFMAGKTPVELVGLSTPKITITPFPTLIMEPDNTPAHFAFEDNISLVTYKAKVFSSEVKPSDLMQFNCPYKSGASTDNINLDLLFVSQESVVKDQLNNKNLTFFIFSLPHYEIKTGSNNIFLSFKIPQLLPSGKYKAILNILRQDNFLFRSNCVSQEFTLTNDYPYVLAVINPNISHKTPSFSANKIPLLIYANATLPDLKPTIAIKDVIRRDNKIYWQKTLPKISVVKNIRQKTEVDLTGVSLKGTYLVDWELRDATGQLISSPLVQTIYLGDAPKVNSATVIAKPDGSSLVNINYNSRRLPPDQGLELFAMLCTSAGCNFSNRYDLGDKWPGSLLFTPLGSQTSESKINISVQTKGTFDKLINYFNY